MRAETFSGACQEVLNLLIVGRGTYDLRYLNMAVTACARGYADYIASHGFILSLFQQIVCFCRRKISRL